MTNIETKTNIAVYTGPGAELAEDIIVVLQNSILFRLINADEVRNGILKKFKLLIMPGGITANYIPYLKQKGCEAIKKFLNNQGGKYLGICAGAYIANSDELQICKSRMIRKSGIFNCEIQITNLAHPIFKGLNNSTITVYYQNGPHIQPYKDEKSLALYKDGSSSVLETSSALIFSWHPEKLPHTIPILFKSIYYLV